VLTNLTRKSRPNQPIARCPSRLMRITHGRKDVAGAPLTCAVSKTNKQMRGPLPPIDYQEPIEITFWGMDYNNLCSERKGKGGIRPVR